MGKKRKFINPEDESEDSEKYEWIEEPKKPAISENKISKTKDDDLFNVLDRYSTNSNSQIKKNKILEKEKIDNELYESRLFKSKDDKISCNLDENWLRKSYNRCIQQAQSTNVPVEEVLNERYDDKMINFMLNKFGSTSKNLNKSKFNDQESTYCSKSNDKSINEINTDLSTQVEQRYVTNEDINEASAALFRAELSKDCKKISKMKKNLETLREAKRRNLKVKLTKKSKVNDESSEVVNKSLKSGKFVPYLEQSSKFQHSSYENMAKIEDKYDADDMQDEFVRISSKMKKITRDDDEDEYHNKCDDPGIRKEKEKAIDRHKKQQKIIKNCKFCYGSLKKHLILTKGENFCVIVPIDGCLVPNHIEIIPRDHISSVARMDDDLYEELCKFKNHIGQFYSNEFSCDTVFTEAVETLDKFPHCVIDCIPIPKMSDQEMSTSLYFRKSIQDAKSDWCVNRGLLQYRANDIRRTVPAEMQYFSVDFNEEHKKSDGLAFVVEKSHKFNCDFGLSICADLLGLDPIIIRQRRRKEIDFKTQSKEIMDIEKRWKKYDKHLKTLEESD